MIKLKQVKRVIEKLLERYVKMKKIMIITILMISMVTANITFAQKIINHDYPRIATLSWAGGNVKWLSKFDLILAGANRDSIIYRSVKAANPNAYILQTLDWNAGGPFRVWGNPGAIPAEWRVRHSDGSYVNIYGSEYMLDVTNYCGLSNGEKYNEGLPRRLVETVDWSAFDGLSSDGTWSFPWNTGGDIDLDRNGVNDFTEHSQAWIKTVWQTGQNIMRNNIRAKYNEKFGNQNAKLIFFWTIADTMCIQVSNGMGWENMYHNGPTNFIDGYNLFNQWDTIGALPRINVITFDTDYDLAHAPANHPKDYFRFMRFGLCTALLHDVYYMTGDGIDHHWTEYYDEYDVKLGYPKGKSQKLSNGCYIRFFDNGVSIVNPTSSNKTVTSNDLAGLSGYDGPYYRFHGNQNPVWNDGSVFTSVILASTPASGGSQYIGDGIILVKTPTTIVSDIIIDNAYSGTSPGSSNAILSGFTWDQSAQYDAPNPTWYNSSQHRQSDANYYNSYYAPAGNGSAKAIYKPTINISGKYNIYEWHGWRGRNSSSYAEASNVPCMVNHANGVANLTIDQSKNYGSWNLVGTYDFTADGNDSIVISNNANGNVISDAIRFEFVGENDSPPAVPELRSPSNGALNITNPPLLSWNTAMGADRYKLEVATDSLFANLVYSDSSITTLSRQTSTLANNMKYFWRVKSINQWGISEWSNVWSLTTQISAPAIPILSTPANSSINMQTSVTLSWNASTGAASYRLQVATDSLFGAKILDDSTLTQTSKQITALLNNTKYYWRVNAKNSGGTSAYSSMRNLTTIIGAPTIPTLLQPADGAINLSTTLILSWNAATYAGSYRVQVSADSLFNTIILDDSIVTGTSKQVNSLSTNTVYYWRVSSKNITGVSLYSEAFKFNTVTSTPVEQIKLTINRTSIDYGKVIVGATKKDSVTFFNSSTLPISINRIYSSSSEYTVNPSTMDLLPGAQKKVYITFYASKRAIITGLVIQISDSIKINDTIKVTGKGVAPQNLRRPKRILLASTSSEITMVDSFVVYNSGDLELAIIDVQSTNPVFSLTPTSTVIAPLDSQYFYVTAKPNMAESKQGYFIFTDNSKQSTDSLLIELVINNEMQPPGIAPTSYSLEQNYPNPFNPTTVIGYQLPVSGHVKMIVYNVIGQEVRMLVNEMQEAGYHSSTWQATDNEGSLLPSGIYFYRINVLDNDNHAIFAQVKRMLLLK